MGLDISFIQVLFGLKAQGVNFDQTVMLGQQGFHVDLVSLQKVFSQQKSLVNLPRAAEFLKSEKEGTERFIRALGSLSLDSIDISDFEGATHIHDMNQPIPVDWKGKYTCLLDGGTLEHIFNFPQAIRNSMELLKIGGSFISVTTANNFLGHGFYQFSPELFYRIFHPINGFEVEWMLIRELSVSGKWYEVVDPDQLQERVTLVNGRPTYLVIHARKIAERPLFLSTPQQSDYVRNWRDSLATNVSKIENTPKSMMKWIPEIFKSFPRRILFRIREIQRNHITSLNKRHYYQRTDLEVILGKKSAEWRNNGK